ncbi:hypothetical protein [Paenibacillus lutimineralis]|uniref:hypothetical protein n=1 Tax=Paenibacillus lutimineralis TaxID=2707005 RepID=UPI001D0363D9|nr:hypothetical protein [Paenibacillus lutimineralis]
MAFYNYCIDLSWQVAWFYYGDYDISVIREASKFARASTECNFDELNYILTLSRDLKLRKVYRDFFNHELTALIREKYNYIKHRGTLHFKGLGVQYDYLGISFGNERIPMLVNEEIDIESWKNKFTREILNKRN